jgi:hypothetical protein
MKDTIGLDARRIHHAIKHSANTTPCNDIFELITWSLLLINAHMSTQLQEKPATLGLTEQLVYANMRTVCIASHVSSVLIAPTLVSIQTEVPYILASRSTHNSRITSRKNMPTVHSARRNVPASENCRNMSRVSIQGPLLSSARISPAHTKDVTRSSPRYTTVMSIFRLSTKAHASYAVLLT